MKETIYTIPISEVFEPKRGCPLCALADTLEERWVQYITGAAMMEPDVRVKTNEEGFCARHLAAMLDRRNRLSVALMLQTRLDYLLKHPVPVPRRGGRGFRRGEPERPVPCFLCGRVEGELSRLADNIVSVWGKEAPFRRLYDEQEYLCHPHHALLRHAGKGLRGAAGGEFLEKTDALLRRGLLSVKEDVDAFCRLYDYRSNAEGQPSARVSSAVERAAARLCGNRFRP